MNRFLQYILLFLLFGALQAFVFGRMQLGPFLYPCIYLLFIFLFPFGYKTPYLLLWSFAIGLSVDILSAGVLGMHTSATLCVGLLRQSVLKLVAAQGDFGPLATPGLHTLGYRRYLTFVTLLLLIHHSVLFGLEAFRFSFLPLVFIQVLCSTVLNVLCIAIVQATFFGQKRGSNNY